MNKKIERQLSRLEADLPNKRPGLDPNRERVHVDLGDGYVIDTWMLCTPQFERVLELAYGSKEADGG